MKIMLDSCVYGKAKWELIESGHDVIWVGDWEYDPGDNEIIEEAFRQNRILITLDKDFGELAIIYEKPHCGIVRLVNISSQNQAKVCLELLKRFGEELQNGAIVTVDRHKLRVRPPPTTDH